MYNRTSFNIDHYLSHFQKTHPREIDLSLERMERLLDDLGNPHHSFPPVIHVAGTNGKGSTITFMKAICEEANLKAHVYTSPHLIRFNERIVINSNAISDDLLYHYLEHIQRINNDQPLTFFEAITAAAFLAFSDHPADLILLETGLGGRLDATNVIPNPAVCVITPISYDHMDFLGTTIEEIAHEKAGVIKANTQVIIAEQEYPSVYDILTQKAHTAGATIIPPPLLQNDTSLGLRGLYQPLNARAAIGAIKAVNIHLKNSPFTPTIISQGLKKAQWPGRMQRISQEPEIWLEGAHNEAGFQQLRQQLHLWKSIDNRPLHLGVAILSNRDPSMIFKYFEELVDKIYAIDYQEVNINGNARFHSPQEFATLWSKDDCSQIECEILTLEETLRKMMNNLENRPRNVITGSLYLVGKVLTLLEEVK